MTRTDPSVYIILWYNNIDGFVFTRDVRHKNNVIFISENVVVTQQTVTVFRQADPRMLSPCPFSAKVYIPISAKKKKKLIYYVRYFFEKF